jgi:hypothetical protein
MNLLNKIVTINTHYLMHQNNSIALFWCIKQMLVAVQILHGTAQSIERIFNLLFFIMFINMASMLLFLQQRKLAINPVCSMSLLKMSTETIGENHEKTVIR